MVTIGFFRKDVRDNIGSRNLLVPTAGYIPLDVTEVTSGQRVTVYNQAPDTRGLFDVLWGNYEELNSSYRGLDVSFTKRLSQRWMAFGGVSVGRNNGDIYGSADLNNPNFTYRRGIIDNDTPVAVKVSGTYQFPYGINFTGSLQHSSGLPQQTTVLVTAATVRLTQVQQSLVVEPRATTRYDHVNQTDISVRKALKLQRLTIEPVLDIYNLFNSDVATGVVTQRGPTYGNVRTIIDGRMVKAGVSINF